MTWITIGSMVPGQVVSYDGVRGIVTGRYPTKGDVDTVVVLWESGKESRYVGDQLNNMKLPVLGRGSFRVDVRLEFQDY